MRFARFDPTLSLVTGVKLLKNNKNNNLHEYLANKLELTLPAEAAMSSPTILCRSFVCRRQIRKSSPSLTIALRG